MLNEFWGIDFILIITFIIKVPRFSHIRELISSSWDGWHSTDFMAAYVNGPYLLKAVKGKHYSALHLSWVLEDKMEKIIEKQTEEDLQVLSVEEDVSQGVVQIIEGYLWVRC